MAIQRCGLYLVTAVTLILSGCSGTSGSQTGPLLPDSIQPDHNIHAGCDYGSNRFLWGIWDVRISEDLSVVEVVPDREAMMHMNCVRLLEVTPCTDCLKLKNLELADDNVITAELELTHPYKVGNLKMSGFDVRAIFIGDADYTFPASGHSVAVGDSVPRLLNPDGYTSLFNPTDFPQTNPPALGYIPGNYTMGGDFTATVNPFVAFNKDEPRRIFLFQKTYTEMIRVQFPDGPMEFGYAIDGCWQEFPGPCIDPIEDFPPDANCLEAYSVTTYAGPGLSLDPGSWTWVYATVYDRQGFDTIESVRVEIPEVVNGPVEMEWYDTRADGGHVFRLRVENELGVGTGDYPFLVRVVDTAEDQNLGPIDAWSPGILPVREGWVTGWVSDKNYDIHHLAVNDTGDIYALGHGTDNVDYDPYPAEDIEPEDLTTFLSKFDWGGGYEWSLRWDLYFLGTCGGLALDQSGNVYIVGTYKGTADFDAGPGVHEETSFNNGGERNMFLLKLTPDGEFVWVVTWPGEIIVSPEAITTDNQSNIFIGGYFNKYQDFDPGPGTDIQGIDSGEHHAFIVKVDQYGVYQWARTWGDAYKAACQYVVTDSLCNVIAAGRFDGTVDLDPGDGTDIHVTDIGYASSISKFTSDGEYMWGRSLSAQGSYPAPALAVDSGDSIFIAGHFSNVVDFDPGTNIDIRFSNGESDAYLSKYDPEGIYQWVLTWGGLEREYTYNMAIDSFDNIYVLGSFHDTVDFDPGPGVNEKTMDPESLNFYLSRFDSNYTHDWVAAWDRSMGRTIAVDLLGNAYLGHGETYGEPVGDFDPGPTFYRPQNEPINWTGRYFILKMPYDFYWW